MTQPSIEQRAPNFSAVIPLEENNLALRQGFFIGQKVAEAMSRETPLQQIVQLIVTKEWGQETDDFKHTDDFVLGAVLGGCIARRSVA